MHHVTNTFRDVHHARSEFFNMLIVQERCQDQSPKLSNNAVQNRGQPQIVGKVQLHVDVPRCRYALVLTGRGNNK